MTPVFIPWSNHRVFESHSRRTGILTDQVIAWLAENFGGPHFSLRPDDLHDGSVISFVRQEHALLFKLTWGGK